MEFVDGLVTQLGFTGWQFNVIASLLFVVIFMFSVIVIGLFVNKFEQLQMRLLSKIVGGRGAEFICNRVLFLGTVIHELSHALFAFCSGAKVTKIRCFTLFSKDTLGYVQFSTVGSPWRKAFQLAFTSCAPTVVGVGLSVLLFRVLQTADLSMGFRIFLIYLLISIVDHMSMSPVDVKNYIKGCFLIFVALFVFSMAFHHFFV